jgi:maleylpyruvate isomerase
MTGARQALGGPSADLLLAYRGTAYFLRALSQLSERDYDEPGRPGAESRRRTIAIVGYDARSWAQAAQRVREGRADPAGFEVDEREEAIALGETLAPRAHRHLVEHSATHLRVEWRDLPASLWARRVRESDGARYPLEEIPRRRALQTWTAAVDLGTGARTADLPRELFRPPSRAVA